MWEIPVEYLFTYCKNSLSFGIFACCHAEVLS
uniref:Uncharacterized protein n=1 Tax=Arundo donax TaxID=35708 RepID=A0A0A9CAS1_ARUDO